MKFLTLSGAMLVMIAAAPCSSSAESMVPELPTGGPTNASSPQIQFGSTVYDFGRVVVGAIVRHDFVFTNTGDAVLHINGVYPSCGCTTAGTWSRQVPPGQTGIIPLQFDSGHFGGQTVLKTATVVTTDKNHPTVRLELKGSVWRPINVNPPMAVLNVVADAPSNAPAIVHIVSGLDEPLTLSDPVSNNHAFTAELKTIRPGKEYQLIINTVPPLRQGNTQGAISVKTSSTNMPVINVSAIAIVQPAVVVMPAQVTLPPGPLSSAFPCAVSIRNNAATPLTLSEPAVNASGVDVQIKEVQPGKQFTLSMTFPAGFQVVQGQQVELNVHSSNPDFALIKVPVRQMLRPPQTQPRPLYRGPTPPPMPPRSAGGGH
jgi:hypothetical protein